jgi:thioesterase domain-containing protein
MMFCLPYGGGGVSQYRELAGLLTPVAQVLGVEEPADGPQTLTAVAAEMFVVMRSRQPRGPYFLLGYSLGGVYAYEVARLALETGEHVGLLCMIDSPAPLPAWREFLTEDVELAVKALEGFADGTLEGESPGPVRAALQAVHVTDDQLGRGREYAADVLRSLIRQLRLINTYEPGRIDASLLLFEAHQSAWPSDLADAWGEIVRFVKPRTLPGDHKTVLSAPHVADIARSITEALGHKA